MHHRSHALAHDAHSRSWGWRSTARVAIALIALCHATAWAAFGLDDVGKRARQLAQVGYQSVPDRLPQTLRDLDYDQYRNIRFKSESALWREDKLPFELMFFHRGRQYRDAVRINEVNARGVTPIAFDPADYDYGNNKIDPKAVQGLGHAGFRVHYAVNRPNHKDEVLVFLGASYFRAIGKDQVYGLSARGVALDVAAPQGEEFPRFIEFWVVRPSASATSLTVYALMDSRRVTGAYRFELTPGAETVVNVKAIIYQREVVGKLGLAPLTSMFHFGENQPGHDDYRPEVHDSDGLAVHTGEGEWLWRPLVNPQRLLVSSFATVDPRGFGLMQRDRAHSSYEDPEALYDRRPSAWIEPIGKWGPGRVELVQIPTPDETNDNIVAYWVPDKPPPAHQPLAFAYRLRWQQHSEVRPPTAWVAQSRRGRGITRIADGHIKFVVDFDGPALRLLPAEANIEADVSVGTNAELVERNLFKNRATGLWRMTVRVRRIDHGRPIEIRAAIRQRQSQNVLSETWSYLLAPRVEKP
jgi:glucans biosynthesis protein